MTSVLRCMRCRTPLTEPELRPGQTFYCRRCAAELTIRRINAGRPVDWIDRLLTVLAVAVLLLIALAVFGVLWPGFLYDNTPRVGR